MIKFDATTTHQVMMNQAPKLWVKLSPKGKANIVGNLTKKIKQAIIGRGQSDLIEWEEMHNIPSSQLETGLYCNINMQEYVNEVWACSWGCY